MQVGKLSILGDSTQTSKGFFQIASGNATTDRPSSPVNSMLRYNTVGNYFEGYQNSAWSSFVTNVGLTLPAMFTVSNSPVTSAGTLTAILATQVQNLVFASPNGAGGVPTFRAIVAADMANTGGTAYQILGVNSAGTAMEYKTVSAGTGISVTPGAGTLQIANTGVTNVGLALPAIFTTSGSPVTTTGTLTATLATQTQNLMFASPAGAGGFPTFRALVNGDLPATINVQTAITMPTMTAGDSSTNGATTAFVGTAITNALLSVYVFKGALDITATPPSSPKTGDTYRISTGGTPNAGYTFTPAQTRCDVGDHITYNGSTWERYEDVNPAVTQGAGITVTATGDTSYQVAITNSITAGAVGSASTVPTFSYTAQGLIASASSVSIAINDSAVTWASRAQNLVFATPNGAGGVPTFRAVVAADIATTGGTAAQMLGINVGGTALEYKTMTAGTGMSISQTAGVTTFNNTGVTNVGLALPNIFTTSGSPVTTSGTLTAVLATTTANVVFAGPNGTGGTPTFRALVATDIPNLDASKITTGQLVVAQGGTGVATTTANVVFAGPNGSGGAPSFRALVATDIPALSYVTNVGLALPNIFTVSGSPVTAAGTLTAILATQTQSTFLAAPSASNGVPTFRTLTTTDLPASSVLVYRTAFTNASLSSGILTVSHALNHQYAICHVYDNNNKRVDPDDITCTTANALTVDVTSWGTLTGTWNAVVLG